MKLVQEVKIQAKHIPEPAILLAIDGLRQMPTAYRTREGLKFGIRGTVSGADICRLWPNVPEKVIWAKLERMVERGVLISYTNGYYVIGDLDKVIQTPIRHYPKS